MLTSTLECDDDDSYNDEDDCSLISSSFDATVDYWQCIRRRQDSFNEVHDDNGLPYELSTNNGKQIQRCGLRVDTGRTYSKASDVQCNYFEFSASTSPGKARWLRAIKLSKKLTDPWLCFNISTLPVEKVIRHRYNAIKKLWVEDVQHVKIEHTVFDSGAMRDCYRLKKFSSMIFNSDDWSKASNYVAKCYKNVVKREVYFEDVRLQMDAKLWAEEFNRHNPPKKVDIFQMCIIEFVERPDKPLYHLEHFIEGDYIKYNSNSGFVDENSRNTPQALSHFTFERSGHALIVVDIQGVDDLYTDPQIHTAAGDDYGDGNLGTRGMALFFQYHVCNDICNKLGLSRFDLAPSELEERQQNRVSNNGRSHMDSGTQVRVNHEIEQCVAPILVDGMFSTLPVWSPGVDSGFGAIAEDEEYTCCDEDNEAELSGSFNSSGIGSLPHAPFIFPRRGGRMDSMSETDNMSKEDEEATRIAFQATLAHKQRSSCVVANLHHCHSHRDRYNVLRHRNDSASSDSSSGSDLYGRIRNNSTSGGAFALNSISVLGLIHLEMSRCHEIGRFKKVTSSSELNSSDSVDWSAAVFHAEQAARLGVVEAALNLAQLWLAMDRSMFTAYEVEENPDKGLEFMELAAQLGDRSAMLHMAQVLETGFGTGSPVGRFAQRDWTAALNYYQRVVEREGEADAAGGYDSLSDTPLFKLQAKMAELLLHGGPNLSANPERAAELFEMAAETATSQGQGKLADRYYTLSGEAYGLLEET